MTRRISPVAVCCSSASVSSRLRSSSSWNSRAFSMAMTAWSAKVSSSAICWSGEGPDLSTRRARWCRWQRPRAAGDGEDGPMPLRSDVLTAVADPAGGHGCDRRGRRGSPVPRRTARSMQRPGRAASLAAGPDARRLAPSELRRRGTVVAVDATDDRRSRRRRAGRRSRAIVSKTGWTSVGELAMTRRISPVAVCCSSASVSSRLRASSSSNSRAFSMAMTAWSANVFRRAICLSVKGRTSRRHMTRAPMARRCAAGGPPGWCGSPACPLDRGRRVCGIGAHVVDVDDPLSSTARPAAMPRVAAPGTRKPRAVPPATSDGSTGSLMTRPSHRTMFANAASQSRSRSRRWPRRPAERRLVTST